MLYVIGKYGGPVYVQVITCNLLSSYCNCKSSYCINVQVFGIIGKKFHCSLNDAIKLKCSMWLRSWSTLCLQSNWMLDHQHLCLNDYSFIIYGFIITMLKYFYLRTHRVGEVIFHLREVLHRKEICNGTCKVKPLYLLLRNSVRTTAFASNHASRNRLLWIPGQRYQELDEGEDNTDSHGSVRWDGVGEQ